jgi:hypothetical protein
MTILDEALSHMAATVKTYLVILFIFLFTLPSLVAALEERDLWDHLFAWTTLNDYSKSIPNVELTDIVEDSWSSCKREEHLRLRPFYICKCAGRKAATGSVESIDAPLRIILPRRSSYPAGVCRAEVQRVGFFKAYGDEERLNPSTDAVYDPRTDALYEVAVSDEQLPFSTLVIARRSGTANTHEVYLRRAFRLHRLKDGRYFWHAPDLKAEPERWDEIKALLLQNGFDLDPKGVLQHAPEIYKVAATAYAKPPHVTVLGIDLPARFSISISSFLLFLIALGFVLPTRVILRSTQADARSANSMWFLAVPMRWTLSGIVYDVLLVGLSLIMIASPFYILAYSIPAGDYDPELVSNSDELILALARAAISCATAILLARALFALFKLRHIGEYDLASPKAASEGRSSSLE